MPDSQQDNWKAGRPHSFQIYWLLEDGWRLISIRWVHEKSKDDIWCFRGCFTAENFGMEILPHGDGQCPIWALLGNHRYHRIRTIIADKFRKNKDLEVCEDGVIADEGSI